MTDPSGPTDAAGPAQPAQHTAPSEEEGRRYPSTIGGLFYIVILLAAIGGVWLVVSDDWRLGIRVLAGCLAAAGTLRLLLRQRDAGMLAVRSRWVDVLMFFAVAVALWWLAGSIPDQPAP